MDFKKPSVPPWLERHWPLTLAIVCAVSLFEWFRTFDPAASATSASGFLVALIPNLVASLVIAAVLYVLIRRDFRSDRGESAIQSFNEVARELNEIRDLVALLHAREAVIRTRADLPSLAEMFDGATAIDLVAVSGIGLINQNYALLEDQLQQGKCLRAILLDDTDEHAFIAWDRLSNPPMNTPSQDIRSARLQLEQLPLGSGPGRLDLRLSQTLFPYSIVHAAGPSTAVIQVEIYGIHIAPQRRANLVFYRDREPDWYAFFVQQLEAAWLASAAAATNARGTGPLAGEPPMEASPG